MNVKCVNVARMPPIWDRTGSTNKDNASRTPDRDFRCFTHVRYFYLSRISIPALGKDKKRTAASWPHVDP